MKFYTIMIDYGRDTSKVHGFEAVVKPEMTRREVVEEVRDILASDSKSLAFVKFTDGNYTEDVTDEIRAAIIAPAIERNLAADRQAAAWDHARDLRKHEVA